MSTKIRLYWAAALWNDHVIQNVMNIRAKHYELYSKLIPVLRPQAKQLKKEDVITIFKP